MDCFNRLIISYGNFNMDLRLWIKINNIKRIVGVYVKGNL